MDDMFDIAKDLFDRFLEGKLTDEEKNKWEIKEIHKKVRAFQPVISEFPVDDFPDDAEFYNSIDDIKEFHIDLEEDVITTYSIKRK